MHAAAAVELCEGWEIPLVAEWLRGHRDRHGVLTCRAVSGGRRRPAGRAGLSGGRASCHITLNGRQARLRERSFLGRGRNIQASPRHGDGRPPVPAAAAVPRTRSLWWSCRAPFVLRHSDGRPCVVLELLRAQCGGQRAPTGTCSEPAFACSSEGECSAPVAVAVVSSPTSMSRCGSARSSQAGSHQFQGPAVDIGAGNCTELLMTRLLPRAWDPVGSTWGRLGVAWASVQASRRAEDSSCHCQAPLTAIYCVE